MVAEDRYAGARSRVSARLGRLAHHPDAPLACATVVAIATGIALRWQALGFPPGITFDEHHFVENARNYLTARSDWNDHPPLGKLLIAASISAFGDRSWGWRAPMALVGTLSVAFAFLAGRRAFGSWRAGAVAAGLLALDGFFIAYSRTALLDGLLASAYLGTTALLVGPLGLAALLGAAVLMGIAMSIKFSGIVLLLPVSFATLLGGPFRLWQRLALLPALGLVAAGVYVAAYATGLSIAQQPSSPVAVAEHTARLWEHHAKLTDMTHPETSYWYTWFIPMNPIWMRHDVLPGAWVRVMATLGSPLTWWGSTVAAISVAVLSTVRASRARERGMDPGRLRILVLAWAAPVLPWVFSARDSYLYHYLPAYGAALVLLGGLSAWLYRTRYLAGLGVVLVLLVVAGAYAPLGAQLPIQRAYLNALLFFPPWRS
jgi:dolichyl-phosphate-mannose-protein mannosyltransferase